MSKERKAVIYGDFRGDRETIQAMEQELSDFLETAGELSAKGDDSINSTDFWYRAAKVLEDGAKDLGPRIRQLREDVESRQYGEDSDRRPLATKAGGAHSVYSGR
jgi:hypothetical protein